MLVHCNFLGFLGVNMGQISIFHFITQKAHPCAIPHLLSHCASKSVQGSLLYVGPRKKNKKVTQKVIFHPFVQKSPVNRFLPNLEQMFISWT